MTSPAGPTSSIEPTSTHRSSRWALRQRVSVRYGEVATDVFGDGPPVVLVHGTPAWSFLWRGVIPALAASHRVYVWDLLGFGDSTISPSAAPSIATQAATLAELIEHWELRSPALIGTDIGGGIVLRTHLIHRVEVDRLALLDAAVIGPWNTPFTEHQQQYAEAYRTMPPDVFRDLIDRRVRTATHRPMSDRVADAYLTPWSGAEGQRRWVDQVRAVRHQDTLDVVARLDRITAPTLVLWGEQDGWLPTTTGARLADAIPTARLSTIGGAGHFLAEDAPAATANALAGFLDEPVSVTTGRMESCP